MGKICYRAFCRKEMLESKLKREEKLCFICTKMLVPRKGWNETRGAGSPGQGVNWPPKIWDWDQKLIPHLCRTDDFWSWTPVEKWFPRARMRLLRGPYWMKNRGPWTEPWGHWIDRRQCLYKLPPKSVGKCCPRVVTNGSAQTNS